MSLTLCLSRLGGSRVVMSLGVVSYRYSGLAIGLAPWAEAVPPKLPKLSCSLTDQINT